MYFVNRLGNVASMSTELASPLGMARYSLYRATGKATTVSFCNDFCLYHSTIFDFMIMKDCKRYFFVVELILHTS